MHSGFYGPIPVTSLNGISISDEPNRRSMRVVNPQIILWRTVRCTRELIAEIATGKAFQAAVAFAAGWKSRQPGESFAVLVPDIN